MSDIGGRQCPATRSRCLSSSKCGDWYCWREHRDMVRNTSVVKVTFGDDGEPTVETAQP